ncbi:hypothetical protein ASPZODRAFT_1392612 [Penicilliopsis zonata CBS 506.65]|uniref:Uncharacterized protein n=1 Tax=Penicilliopsis zonata CBS 506.65 TaxID=1073090 RepID=A0A1L9SPM9_9EURO|nr:hypothetical protein ASPZODRAFT_1392612 [Penicilliopsis zonata CBS 506.65]OJJ49076.1 hypothetical protein ASPZODRAFT_1392612 [Penicilliopsis zonata CBS 506.65]
MAPRAPKQKAPKAAKAPETGRRTRVRHRCIELCNTQNRHLPPQPGTLWSLSSWPDPPPLAEDEKFMGQDERSIVLSHEWNKSKMIALLEHHSWGIDTGIDPQSASKKQIFLTLYAIWYNTEPRFRAFQNDVKGFLDASKDAGPRLLKGPNKNGAWAHPISRYYPSLPTVNEAWAPNYTRPRAHPNFPDSIPSHFSDSWMERLTLGNAGGPMDGYAEDPRYNPPTDMTNNVADDSQPANQPATQPATQLATTQAQPGTQTTTIEQDFADMVALISTALEKAFTELAYKGLERHPRAYPLEMVPYEGLKMTDPAPYAFIQTGAAKISHFDVDGIEFPTNGRGPMWANQSCAIDCCIVASKLLDAGCTVIDRGANENWLDNLSDTQRSFLKVVNEYNWEIVSPAQSMEVRDRFWKNKLARHGYPFGHQLSAASLWTMLTQGFGQFEIQRQSITFPCSCHQGAAMTKTDEMAYTVTPAKINVTESISQLLQDAFPLGQIAGSGELKAKATICRQCHQKTKHGRVVRVRQMPMRLAVELNPGVRVTAHTSQIVKFKYRDWNNREVEAKYRWLGGIYYQEGHFRVYWNQDKRGEKSGCIQMYDDMQNQAFILGGFPSSDPDERVRQDWVSETPPMLFYERVFTPSVHEFYMATISLSKLQNRLGVLHQAPQFREMVLRTKRLMALQRPPLKTEIKASMNSGNYRKRFVLVNNYEEDNTALDKAEELSYSDYPLPMQPLANDSPVLAFDEDPPMQTFDDDMPLDPVLVQATQDQIHAQEQALAQAYAHAQAQAQMALQHPSAPAGYMPAQPYQSYLDTLGYQSNPEYPQAPMGYQPAQQPQAYADPTGMQQGQGYMQTIDPQAVQYDQDMDLDESIRSNNQGIIYQPNDEMDEDAKILHLLGGLMGGAPSRRTSKGSGASVSSRRTIIHIEGPANEEVITFIRESLQRRKDSKPRRIVEEISDDGPSEKAAKFIQDSVHRADEDEKHTTVTEIELTRLTSSGGRKSPKRKRSDVDSGHDDSKKDSDNKGDDDDDDDDKVSVKKKARLDRDRRESVDSFIYTCRSVFARLTRTRGNE